MAFKKDQSEMTKILRETLNQENKTKIQNDEEALFERKKNYQFMLKPSNREKLRQLATESGKRSDSAFLDDLIENL